MREDKKGRPLKMKFSTTIKRNKVLSKGPAIRKAASTNFNTKTIYIKPDLTTLERRDDINLRIHLKEMRGKDPNTGWTIRKGRVVKKAVEDPPQNADG